MESNLDKKGPSQCFVKNICVSDVVTGLIVFQKVYKWKETSAFHNLGGLINVFYQFARDVDDGFISCVNFESGRKISTRLRNNDTATGRNQTMQMLTIKSDDIIVSLFFDMQGQEMPSWEEKDKLRVLLHSVKATFDRNHLEELRVRRPTLQQECEDHSVLSGDSEGKTLTTFMNFGQAVDLLRQHLFPFQDGSTNVLEDVVLDPSLSLQEHVNEQLRLLEMRGLIRNSAPSHQQQQHQHQYQRHQQNKQQQQQKQQQHHHQQQGRNPRATTIKGEPSAGAGGSGSGSAAAGSGGGTTRAGLGSAKKAVSLRSEAALQLSLDDESGDNVSNSRNN